MRTVKKFIITLPILHRSVHLTVPAMLTMAVPVATPNMSPADIVRGIAGMASICSEGNSKGVAA